MEAWLQCKLTPGQFEGELGVDGEQHNGTPFSLFVPKEFTKADASSLKETLDEISRKAQSRGLTPEVLETILGRSN